MTRKGKELELALLCPLVSMSLVLRKADGRKRCLRRLAHGGLVEAEFLQGPFQNDPLERSHALLGDVVHDHEGALIEDKSGNLVGVILCGSGTVSFPWGAYT